MTRAPAPELSPAEAARVAAFDAAQVPPECDPERASVDWDTAQAEMLRVLCVDHGHDRREGGMNCRTCRRRVDALLPIVRALVAQGQAEAPEAAELAVKRVEALIAFYDRHEYSTLNVEDLRAALASPAPAPQGGGQR